LLLFYTPLLTLFFVGSPVCHIVDAPKHPHVSYQTHVCFLFDSSRLDVPWQCPVPACEFSTYVRLTQASNLHQYDNNVDVCRFIKKLRVAGYIGQSMRHCLDLLVDQVCMQRFLLVILLRVLPWQCPVPGCEFSTHVRLAQASNLHRYENIDSMVIPTLILQTCQPVKAGAYMVSSNRTQETPSSLLTAHR